MLALPAMGDAQLNTAIGRIDSALARIEAALNRTASAGMPPPTSEAAALTALEQRHAALRQVMSESVRELDTLLAAAEGMRAPGDGQ